MAPAQPLIFKILIRIMLVIGLALAIILIPNLPIFDEKLLPEITERLSKRPNPHIDDNAFYSLHGIGSASDKDAYAAGKAIVKTLQSKHPKGEMAKLTEKEQIALYGGQTNWDEQWQALYPTCNTREKSDCFNELLTQIKNTPLTDPRLLSQMGRYNIIIQQTHYVEDTQFLDYTSPLPNLGTLLQLGKLKQADAYQHAGINGLIAASQIDIAFWRMALKESQTLLAKMVAIAALRQDLRSISYAISKESYLTPAQIQQLQQLFLPLTSEEINIEEGFTAELRFSAENQQSAPKVIYEGTPIMLWALMQRVATTNWFYRQTLKPMFAFSKLSAKEFYEKAQQPVKVLEFAHFNPYNLGGKIMMSTNWQLAGYQGRAHDLASIYSLVALQLELKNISSQDLAVAIKGSSYKNLYTGKPFDYEATTRTLNFRCFDIKDECKITL